MSGFGEFWFFFTRRPVALVGLAILVGVGLCAALGPVISPRGPWEMVGPPLVWPGVDARFPLGTDTLGRDISSGLLHGAWVSLAIGISATAAALLIGVTIGAVSGYFGGRIGDALMRVTEVFQTIPSFMLVLIIVGIFSPSLVMIVLAIGVSTWPPVARVVRAEFLSLRQREYVQSCIVLGMSAPRIILTQILPNSLAPILSISTVMVATAILSEASLSFLGLGDPNVMSWGTMVSVGRNSLRTAWYMVAVPGVAIILTVVALNLFGEGLNDALNPRLREA